MQKALLRLQATAARYWQHLPLDTVLIVLALASLLAIATAALLIPGSLPQADDFCLAGRLHTLSFIELMHNLYLTWTGRLLSHALIALPGTLSLAGVIPFAKFFPLANSIILASFAVGLWLFWQTAFRKFTPALLATVAGLGWWLWHMPSLLDGLYWYAADVTYTVALPLMILAIISYHFILNARSQLHILWAVPLAIISMVSLTSINEIPALLATILAVATIFYPMNNLRRTTVILIALTTLAALAVLVAAPGNAVRIAASTNPLPLPVALIGGLPMGLGLFLDNITLSLLAWLTFIGLYTSQQKNRSQAFWNFAALTGIVMLLTTLAAPAVGLKANGEAFPLRTFNLLHLQLWLGLTFIACWLAPRFKLKTQAANNLIKIAAVVLALSMVCNGNYIRGANDIRRVRAFATEYAQREEQFKQAAAVHKPLVVAPLDNMPKTVFRETIGTNPSDWQNQCVATWYGLPSVSLAP